MMNFIFEMTMIGQIDVGTQRLVLIARYRPRLHLVTHKYTISCFIVSKLLG